MSILLIVVTYICTEVLIKFKKQKPHLIILVFQPKPSQIEIQAK
jgi:hypothetical protein